MTTEAKKLPFEFDQETIGKIVDLSADRPWAKPRKAEIAMLLSCCSNLDQASLVTDVLSNYNFVQSAELNNNLKSIANHIVNNLNLLPHNTVIVCRDIEGKTDSSAAIQQMLKPHFGVYPGWSSNRNFRSELKRVVKDKGVENIVLVDDFSGTGRSLEKLLLWIEDTSYKSNRAPPGVFAIFVGCMAETLYRDYPSFLKDIYFEHACSKAFSNPSNSAEIADRKRKTMREVEINHGGVAESYSLGYMGSEAAFSLENMNTPNNVLPIIWSRYPVGVNGSALFPRISKR